MNYSWTPKSKQIAQWVLEYGRKHPSKPTQYFSRISLANIGARKGNDKQYQCGAIGAVSDEEWLSGLCVKTMRLEGTGRHFVVNGYCRILKKGTGERAVPTPIIGAFKLQFTENGIEIVPLTIKNEMENPLYRWWRQKNKNSLT